MLGTGNNRYVTDDRGIGSRSSGGSTSTGGSSSGTRKSTNSKKVETPSVNATGSGVRNGYYAYGGGGGGGESESNGIDELLARISAAYDNAASLLKGNYDSQVGVLNKAKKKSTKELNVDSEQALREAYVTKMQNQRDLNQRLAAMGLNGGATETTMARLANQYGNSRTDVNNTRNRSLAGINQTYSEQLAAALQAYNSAMANLEMQRLNAELSLYR